MSDAPGAVPPGERAGERIPGSPSQPFFTAPLRGGGAGPDAFARWERVLGRERSLGYAAVRLASRMPRLRRLAGLPAIADEPPVALEDREAVVAVIAASPLLRPVKAARAAYRRRRGGGPAGAAAGAGDGASAVPAGPAAAGGPDPRTDRLIDEAIETLRGVPFEEVQRRGWHFQPNHFYWPLNDVGFLERNRDLWHDRGLPRDVRWHLDEQLALVARLDGYRGELHDVPRLPRPGRVEFVWENNAFGGADAAVYYGLVRELRPRRVVEVGAGWSSLLLARALARNETPCAVTLIEPHPNTTLLSALPEDFELQERTLQRADLAVFERLGPGDLCLFDGSHCSSTASDVNWFLFEVMPRLARGVWAHVHDILVPEDYRDRWILDEGLTWNEQYVVQALLMHNDAYAVRVANHMLWIERRAEIERLHGGDGTSLWLEKRADAER